MERTHLLCTFAHRKDLALIADYIEKTYTLPEQKIFVFNNEDEPNELYCTYNVSARDDFNKAQSTILIHRKKETNTLYTVNALNVIIRKANNGLLDKSFIIEWDLYQNSLLLTNADSLRRIKLELYRRIDI